MDLHALRTAPHCPADRQRLPRIQPPHRCLPAILLLILGGVLFAFTEWLRVRGARGMLGESGPIEVAQLVLLTASGAAISWSAAEPRSRPVLVPMLTIVLAAIARELDGPMDRLAHGSWKVPAWTMVSIGAVYASRRPGDALRGARRVAASRAGGFLAGALFVVFVQSRILGRQEVWSAVLGSAYVRDVPRLVEELSELAGYGLLFIACIELRRVRWVRMRAGARARPA